MTSPVKPTTTPSTHRGLLNLERTRQQLQELDALLQQMLALPLSEPASEASEPAAPAEERPASPNAAPKRLQTLPIQPAVDRAPAPVHLKAPRPLDVPFAEPPSTEPPATTVEPPQPETSIVVSSPAADPAQKLAPATVTMLPVRPLADIPSSPPPDADPELQPSGIFDAADLDLTGAASFDVSREEELADAGADPIRWLPGTQTLPPREPWLYRCLLQVNAAYESLGERLGPLGQVLLAESFRASLGWIGLVCLFGAIALGLGLVLGWTW